MRIGAYQEWEGGWGGLLPTFLCAWHVVNPEGERPVRAEVTGTASQERGSPLRGGV